jgi:hypothetical protein
MKLTIITAALTMLLFSCQKTGDLPRSKQREITAELGFDLSRITFVTSSRAQPLTFQTIADAKQYFNNLKSRAVPFRVVTIPRNEKYRTSDTIENSNRTIYTTSMTDWWLWTGYNVTFNWERSAGGIDVSNWNSGIVGMTLGASWDHTGSSSYVDKGIVYFTITGYQNYNLIVEGIGTMFQEQVTINGYYNTTTNTGYMTEN